MRVKVLYFEGCPTYLKAEKTLRGVLAQEDAEEADVELVAVNTDKEAQRLRFPCSPTIRVDGEDLFPVPDQAEYALVCRMYATQEYWTLEEVAERLKVNRRTVNRWVEDGKLTAVKFAPGRGTYGLPKMISKSSLTSTARVRGRCYPTECGEGKL